MVRPAAYRQAVGFLRGEFEFSERRACTLLGFQRSSCRYVARRTMVQGLLEDIRAHAAARPRFGYRRIHVLLRRGGWRVNHKRVYRIYRAEGLAVRRRKRKRMAVGLRTVLPPPSRVNERWTMDFTLDTLASGRRFRTFNIVDDFTRECLAIEVDTSIGGSRVARCFVLALRQARDAVTLEAPMEATSRERGNALPQVSKEVVQRKQSPATELDYERLFIGPQYRAAPHLGPHRPIDDGLPEPPLRNRLRVQAVSSGEGPGALFRPLELGSNTRRRAGATVK
jgi:hypothetical protein